MNRVELKEWSKKKIKGNLWNIWLGELIVIGVTLLMVLVGGVIAALFDSESTTSIIILIAELLTVPLVSGLMLYMAGFIKDNEFDKSLIFKPYKNSLKLIFASILMSLLIALGTVCLIIPGIIMSYSYSLTLYLLATHEDLSAIDAMKLSRKMMNGHKLDMFVLCLSFIGWFLLTSITFGIASIWVNPYFTTTLIKFVVDIVDNYEKKNTIE